MFNKQKNAEDLRKKLFFKRKNAWDSIDEKENDKLTDYSEEYLEYLSNSKTEREAIDNAIDYIIPHGFEDIDETDSTDKIFYNHFGKALAIFRKGKKDLREGLNIIVAHVDSPRLDLKQHPLYEDEELVMLKTHYYGGIKKYQWLSRPLAMHGVVVFPDGNIENIVIGEDENDPVFTIADLLPHLAKKAQMNKKASEFIPGEKLNLVVGSIPFSDDTEVKERFKLNILEMLNDKYGMREEDFVSADIEIVPAGNARDIGFDRSLIGGYGQDDRVCTFGAMRAIVEADDIDKSALVLLMDKEEIGSEGATGSNSVFLELVIGEILEKQGITNNNTLMKTLASADCLSSDVNAALHPDWKEVHEKKNAAYLNAGMVLSKFTGSGGKGGSNEANAEFVAKLRRIFDDNKIVWHISELGKVDEGGGGTIAKFMAYYGMNVIDSGVPVLDMHSPFEITSKADIWMMYKGFIAFLED
ncbi:MAG: aminopeptidase [Candidatus Marinimicrobia bacterium]|nr:aminopeptidase [Candidatus Neomarinimicrobiota bacterium]